MERTLTLQTEQDMEGLGTRIARALPQGGFVALYGDLGAGKTVLCRGVGRVLGLGHLSSPTFTIVQEYPTAPPLFHLTPTGWRTRTSFTPWAMRTIWTGAALF